jgi:alpha-L-rhamnosidase
VSGRFIGPAGQPVVIRPPGSHPQPRTEGVNRFLLFRRSFDLPGQVKCAPARVTADGRYQLFVNGDRIGRGPARASPFSQRYDEYDFGPSLRPGRNAIAVLLRVYGIDTAFYEHVESRWGPIIGDGGLWLDGEVCGEGWREPVGTDARWRCEVSEAWDRTTPLMNVGLAHIEVLDGRELAGDWTNPEFDDAGWAAAQVLQAGGGGPEAPLGGMVVRPFPVLKRSTLPPQREAFQRPCALLWAKAAASTPDLPVERRAYEEVLSPLVEGFADQVDALVDDGGVAHIRTAGAVDVCFTVDFGRILAGRPLIEVEAKGGEVIDLVCGESLPGEFDPKGASADARIVRHPMLGLDAHIARYVARPGAQVFETFEWDAARWLQVTIRNAPGGLEIRRLGLNRTGYPADPVGAFACSDPMLNDLWAICRDTLALCMHDAWIDCPGREQRQWIGDVAVEHLVGQAVFGQQVAPLTAEFLRKIAEAQQADGLPPPFAPGDHERFGRLIPDFALTWVLIARDHLDYSGDVATVREIFPSILKALAWFEPLRVPDGRIANLPYWHFQDWAAFGRDGLSTVLNAQFAGALDAAAALATALDWPSEAARLAAEAVRIRDALESHWDETRGLYVDTVDPETGAPRPRVSQHANAAMILWGGVPATRAQSIADRICDEAVLRKTPAPPIQPQGESFDEGADIVATNTFYTHFLLTALMQAGRPDLAVGQIRQKFGPMLARGATTLWETFEPNASLAHGFSTSPAYQLSSGVLGVRPAAAGFGAIQFSPQLGELAWAEGVHATPKGDVRVRLDRTASGFDAILCVPKGVPVNTAAPRHWRIEHDAPFGEDARRISFVRTGTHDTE